MAKNKDYFLNENVAPLYIKRFGCTDYIVSSSRIFPIILVTKSDVPGG